MSTESARRDIPRGAAITISAASYSRVMGANDKLRYGIIGAGRRAQSTVVKAEPGPVREEILPFRSDFHDKQA